MKSLISWFCLATITNASLASAADGLDAYRMGKYNKAATVLSGGLNQDPVANYYLAKMRLYGYGELKNNVLAIQYLKLAADKGFLPAQQMLARYELIDNNNLEQAFIWFKKAAEANDVQAQMYCAAAYLFGLGVRENDDLAKRYYIAAAKNGNSIAQTTLAASFLQTKHSANKQLGLLWLNHALQQHDPEAQLMMAAQYLNGGAVEKNLDKAKEYAGLSVAQNYAPAFYMMGQIELSQQHAAEASEWYKKAMAAQYEPATFALAELYLDSKSPLYNAHQGFLWMLKAAQNGSKKAQISLANLYAQGVDTEVDENIAKEWKDRSAKDDSPTLTIRKVQAVQWLTNRKATKFENTPYALKGIFHAWHNLSDTRQNNYNQPPQMESVSRDELFKPAFVMTKPNDIPISEYYTLLVNSEQNKPVQLAFSHYGLLAQPDLADTNQPRLTDPAQIAALSADQATMYETLFKKLEGQAVLGDSAAQFDVGQMYQYGIGVKKDVNQAIHYYQLAAAQQDLPSEYNLGLLYLTGTDIQPDYPLAINWLTDAAFKGNGFAQYALASIYDGGYRNAENKEVIPADPEQAFAMFNLAAANNDGLAQYRLAEILIRQKPTDLSLTAMKDRQELIKGLYTSAVALGVTQANLPLAFYHAMSTIPAKQQLAFAAATKAAGEGNKEAALLLGLMYDRGITVTPDRDTALNWYQQAVDNPVGAFILGTYYAEGDGVSRDVTKSRELLQKAADSQFSYASLNLAILKNQQSESFMSDLEQAVALGNRTAGLLMADYYLNQLNTPDKLKLSRDIYQRLAEKGDKDAALKLGYLFEQGIGGSQNMAQAQIWYSQAAHLNQPVAQYLLANLYQMGKLGKMPDYTQAKYWYAEAQNYYPRAAVALGFIYDTEDEDYAQAKSRYQLASEHDDIIGAFNLGLIYERGEGCDVDLEKAKTYYSQAAQKGHRQSMVQLAGLYLKSGQRGYDTREAYSWYKKAADMGDRDALYQLALMSETGVGTTLDLAEASRFYQAAAEKGNTKAMLALARLYQYGLGTTKNLQQSEKLYSDLAAHGNSYAQYQLALFCFKGLISGCQAEEGKKWLEKAQSNGSFDAVKALQWLNAQSTPQVSFIESVQLPPSLASEDSSSTDMLYLEALNAWNVGDEGLSKAILARLLIEQPNNQLAKQAYQQLLEIGTAKDDFNLNIKKTASLP